jgi:hypothetical protein
MGYNSTIALKSATVIVNLLYSRQLSKHIKIRIIKNIILPVVLYGCET